MLWTETLLVALASLRANKLRSFLTMLGIVIGIAAVIAMITLGNGAQRSVQDRISALGTTLLQVDATRMSQNGVRLTTFHRMTTADADMLRDSTTTLTEVQAQEDQNQQVTFQNLNTNIRVLGTTANYLGVHKYELDLGRFFTAREDTASRRVAVLGSDVLTALGVDDPLAILGQNIRIRGILFQVIGVLKSKGSASSFENPDEQILIPYNTARFRVFGSPYLGDIFVLTKDEASIPLAMAEIQHWMRRSQRLRPDQPDDFRIRSQSDFLATMGETAQVFTALLAGIAAVSLLVGGIGIMNIMLVSVTERTREIGIRKALGATRRTILLQFMIEAVTLCVAGGAVGITLGVGASLVLQSAFAWNTAVSAGSIGWAFGFAALVGMLFGVWPARRAASLDPIIALRYE
jgi:putative ABC transport system permease protein